jgi:hypothetical protein
MTCKGFAARVEYSEDDGCFIGHIAGIRDVIGFHGESVAELRTYNRTAHLGERRKMMQQRAQLLVAIPSCCFHDSWLVLRLDIWKRGKLKFVGGMRLSTLRIRNLACG